MLSPTAIASALLLAGPLPVAAQALGSPQSQAWLGRGLEFSVPARLDADGRNDCAHAVVHYGARRLDAQQVQAFVQRPAAAGGETRLRVRTDVPIDEPAVTVTVRAGCAGTVTRQYAVLAEPFPDAPVAVAPAPAAPAVQQATPPVAAAATADARTTSAQAATRAAGAGLMPVAVRMRTAPALPEVPRARAEPGGAERPAVLRVSGMLANPLGDPAQREAAARLWQAFSAEPHELVRTAAMLQSLEAELATLRVSAVRTRSEVLQSQRRAEPAPSPFGSPWLAAALLGVLGLGAAWVMRRRGASGAFGAAEPAPWYSAPTANPVPPARSALPTQPQADATPLPQAQAQAAGKPAAPVIAAPAQPAPASPEAPAAAPAPQVAAARAVLAAKVASARANADSRTHVFRVDALASTLQESEFLRSLGLDMDAKAVLRAHITDATSPAPLAYYELMHLCAQGEDTSEIPLLRRRFHEQFDIVAPSMDELGTPGGLERHPKLLARIAAVWPTPRALDIIEKRLFAKPESADYQISLEAWRDLLWLYDFAQHLQMGPAVEGNAQRSESAVMAPWADMDTGGFNVLDFTRAHNFAVDFDLNAAGAPDEWSEGELTLEPLARPALAP